MATVRNFKLTDGKLKINVSGICTASPYELKFLNDKLSLRVLVR